MGKKNKKEKKGLGKEKTMQKMEKNANKKMKKELAEKGEEDIEKMIAEFQQKDKRNLEVVEEKCPPPSQRCNMSLSPHPDKDELIMFGGEYCTGTKMFMYNDLLFYNIKKNEWLKVTAPNAPPPRSSHQAVALRQAGGQLWIFGGEFASPTQSQFYHYKELWVYHLKQKNWEKIVAPGGPSARSGHRMVECKKRLIVFGGFHDNIRDYKYFNDVYMFDLETYKWSQVSASGIPPAPRSGCIMAALPEQGRVLVYGGYSKEKVKKDVDVGKVHTDMFLLAPEGKAETAVQSGKWKWMNVKQSGARPSQRSGVSMATLPGNKLICFGGVVDEEENEEEIKSKFFNDMYLIEAEKGKWFDVELRGKKVSKEKKRRRKKDEQGDEEEEEEENSDVEDMEVNGENIKSLTIEADAEQSGTSDDMQTPGDNNNSEDVTMETEAPVEESVFKVTLGPGATNSATGDGAVTQAEVAVFMPPPRMNCQMAVKGTQLFLYGGIFEAGDKQYTLSDFYSLETAKMDEWKVLIESDLKAQVWDESDSSSDEEDMEGACAGKGDSDSDDDDDDDDDEEIDFSDAPERSSSEPIKDYFIRTRDYWLGKASSYCEAEDMKLSDKKLEKLAMEMCQEAFGKG